MDVVRMEYFASARSLPLLVLRIQLCIAFQCDWLCVCVCSSSSVLCTFIFIYVYVLDCNLQMVWVNFSVQNTFSVKICYSFILINR